MQEGFRLFPEQASTFATRVDHLYWFLIAVTVFFGGLIAVLVFTFAIRYRRRPGRIAEQPTHGTAEMLIEVFWTAVPLMLVIVIFVWASRLFIDQSIPPIGAEELFVVGKQWMWKIQHPEGNREINEIHVPAGRMVKLTLASQDVIHSFFLPVFRIKRDAIPGYYTSEWFRPTKVGTFHLFCAEFCGTHHSGMIGKVIVMEPAAYQEWLAAGRPQSTLAQAGERRFRELGCSGCHMGSSVVRAPPLQGLYGKPVPLQDGKIVTGDEGYIRDSILLPNSQITAGYQPLMPSYQGRVTEEELLELIAYIKSLGKQAPPAGGTQ
jgi:cytochrome c oxidase subunit 2